MPRSRRCSVLTRRVTPPAAADPVRSGGAADPVHRSGVIAAAWPVASVPCETTPFPPQPGGRYQLHGNQWHCDQTGREADRCLVARTAASAVFRKHTCSPAPVEQAVRYLLSRQVVPDRQPRSLFDLQSPVADKPPGGLRGILVALHQPAEILLRCMQPESHSFTRLTSLCQV